LADRVHFFLRLHALELGENQRVVTELLATPLGRHLTLVGTYNGLTKKANYMPGLPDELKATLKAPSDPGPKPYAIMVPIRKGASWWMLSRDERQTLMEEHTRATLPYLKTVKRKLYHSSGLGDCDFLTYFETSKLDDFNNLIISLQMVEEYRHTTRFGHPILIGTIHTVDEVLETLAK
jgi:chlorite dismutase